MISRVDRGADGRLARIGRALRLRPTPAGLALVDNWSASASQIDIDDAILGKLRAAHPGMDEAGVELVVDALRQWTRMTVHNPRVPRDSGSFVLPSCAVFTLQQLRGRDVTRPATFAGPAAHDPAGEPKPPLGAVCCTSPTVTRQTSIRYSVPTGGRNLTTRELGSRCFPRGQRWRLAGRLHLPPALPAQRLPQRR